MYNLNREPIHKYKSIVYIAKKLPTTQDEDLNEIQHYDTPIKYVFNVQPVDSDSDTKAYGQEVKDMFVAVISKSKYKNVFTEYDKVYINTTPEGELENGDNADFRIYGIRPQNACIRIYFKKLVKYE